MPEAPALGQKLLAASFVAVVIQEDSVEQVTQRPAMDFADLGPVADDVCKRSRCLSVQLSCELHKYHHQAMIMTLYHWYVVLSVGYLQKQVAWWLFEWRQTVSCQLCQGTRLACV